MNVMKSRYLAKLVYSLAALSLLGGCVANEIKVSENKFVATQPLKEIAAQGTDGSIYRGQASSFIFEDMKARRVGDILTIVLSEKTNAKKKATTSTKKDNTIDLGSPTVFGAPITHSGRNILGASIGTEQEFTGEGDSEQSNALNGTISVTVASVYPNGNLFVRGQKRMLLNQGDEYIQISGIVRPLDIGVNNTVASTLLADARIVYSGEGAVSDSNKMGWLARFFNSQYWPF
jgi:flagellar L-ring protein precursor FlgH